MRLGWLQEWVERQPFRPFRVKTADGSVYHVTNREYTSLDKERRALLLWDADFNAAVLDSNLISVLEHVEFTKEQ